MTQKNSFMSFIRALKEKRFLFAFLMGFASGLPLLLTSRTMQFWLKESNVDLTTIGIFSIIGLPYTLKFITAPLMDRFKLPFLTHRRGWLVLCQIGVSLFLVLMALFNPSEHLWQYGFCAFMVAFFSANLDVVIDAYRIETLKDEELGMGVALNTYGYKLALLVSGALALLLADHMPWQIVYFLMAVVMMVTVVITIQAPEPKALVHPKSLREAVVHPFKEFFSRKAAIIMLLFIVLYKAGDNMGGNMLSPFYLEKGYTKTEVAIIAKTISPTLSWIGPVLGGSLVFFLGIYGSLWVAGFLQAASTFGFALLALSEKSLWLYGAVVSFEDITAAIGAIALMAFMANITSRQFTATQYALFSSLSGVPRIILSMPTGYLAKQMSWAPYFTFCALIAIPGMLLLFYLKKNQPVKGTN